MFPHIQRANEGASRLEALAQNSSGINPVPEVLGWGAVSATDILPTLLCASYAWIQQ